jgi:hypothetical protein
MTTMGTPVERVIAALTVRGCNPRGAPPKEVSASCPVTAAHTNGDKKQSLTVGESPEGKALIFCHAGCTTPQVAEALGLRMSDLFPDKAPKQGDTGPAGRWRATYPYHDADGELLFEVVRFDGINGKTFRQRRPTSSGGWEWNTNGVAKVLYHLPQVLRAVATGETIIVVEGEKDAENVPWAFGITATCNPGGACKWDDIHTAALDGATKVVVIADDDIQGHKHAAMVMRALEGHVGTVMACLPAVGCKDISDHLKAGHGQDQLRVVTLAELDYIDQDNTDEIVDLSYAHLVDWSTFWSTERIEEDWLAQPFIPRGRAIALYAPAKAGKSSVVLAIVAALATGRPILGRWHCEATSVLYLDYEMTEADIRDRMTELGYHADVDLTNLHYALLPSLPPLDTATGAQALLAIVVAVDAQLVVVDTFTRAVEGKENDSDTVRDFYRHTGRILKAAGRTVVRTDHAGKDLDKGQRGTSGKADDVDVVWQLARTEDDGINMKRTHSRISWVPDAVNLKRTETDDGGITWSVVEAAYPAGTKEVAELLDGLDVPVDAPSRHAQTALRDSGNGRRRSLVIAAQRWRQVALLGRFGADNPVDNRREPPSEPQFSGTPEHPTEPNPKDQVNGHRNRAEPPGSPDGDRGGLLRSKRDPPAPGPATDDTDYLFGPAT